jgi:predicted amidophosphoribosyltransferase
MALVPIRGVMAFGDLVTCPRCGAKVHNQKDHCHNCGLPLVPADPTRPPLRPGPGRKPKGG